MTEEIEKKGEGTYIDPSDKQPERMFYCTHCGYKGTQVPNLVGVDNVIFAKYTCEKCKGVSQNEKILLNIKKVNTHELIGTFENLEKERVDHEARGIYECERIIQDLVAIGNKLNDEIENAEYDYIKVIVSVFINSINSDTIALLNSQIRRANDRIAMIDPEGLIDY